MDVQRDRVDLAGLGFSLARPFQPRLSLLQRLGQYMKVSIIQRAQTRLRQQFRQFVRLPRRVKAQGGRQMGVVIERDFGGLFDAAFGRETGRRVVLALGVAKAIVGDVFVGHGGRPSLVGK
jgi:hypothetical protein